MPVLLRIDSSADGAASRTRRITDAFARAWSERGGDFTVVTRDLHERPLPHLQTSAQHWPERLRQGEPVPEGFDELHAEVLDELLAADVVIAGAPMYNYTFPATLKTWIDLVHIPGVTAPFDVPSQPMRGKPFVVASARGATDDDNAFGYLVAPLRLAFGDGLGMNMHEITTSRTLADRVPDLGADAAAEELRRAEEQARELAARL